jgi:multidrug resistance protein
VESAPTTSPWASLWALCLGFFMILVDATIVSVATPAIMTALGADINAVVWVTSAYLLAYAVPLLITGRLGDRFGPKRVYLVGLTIFTLASLWCGLTGTIGALVAARIVQGLGASLMTPQTMAVITRTFPAESRGRAMGAWGAVAGVATLVGPILGGVLVDGLGWEWIFFVNVPVGILAFVLALVRVPALETHSHRFDWLGVVVLAGFVAWQWRQRGEPLVPLGIFRDRNFSLANAAMTTVGFAPKRVTSACATPAQRTADPAVAMNVRPVLSADHPSTSWT